MNIELPGELGDVDARNDRFLHDSFVKTGCYDKLLKEKVCLIHGRKGTGKTALVEMLPSRESGSANWKYIFASQTPKLPFQDIQSDIDKSRGIFAQLSLNSLFENLWEHFIYDNCMKLVIKPHLNRKLSGNLAVIYSYLTSANLLEGDAITSIKDFLSVLLSSIGPEVKLGEHSLKVTSGNAFETYFQEKHNYKNAVKALQDYLIESDECVLFLIDDVDSTVRSDSPETAVREFFNTLIETTIRVTSPIPNASGSAKIPSPIHVKAFLPTDIYLWLDPRHEDKYDDRTLELAWSEDEIRQMFHQRLRHQCRLGKRPFDDIISRYFGDRIYDEFGKPRPVLTYMIENTFCRPRDIMNLYSTMAVFLKPDERIAEEALYQSIQNYIAKLVEHVTREYSFVERRLQSILNQFVGKPSVYNYNEIYQLLTAKEIIVVDPNEAHKLVQFLWEIGFIGAVQSNPSILPASIELHTLKVEYYYQRRTVALKRTKALVVHPVFRRELVMVNNVKEFFSKHTGK